MENALRLLKEYSGFFVSSCFGTYGGFFGRVIKGKWGNHHGATLERTLDQHYQNNGSRGIAQILSDVRLALEFQEPNDSPLNPHGELATVLAIIQTKTGWKILDKERQLRKERVEAPSVLTSLQI